MKAIGGYFGLELQKGKQTFHDCPAFKSGRSALHYILKSIRPKNVYIPFYTCNGLLEPFEVAQVPYRFYSINLELEPEALPELQAGDYFLYINYFGLKNKMVATLIEKYADKMIIDNSQAFFYKGDGSCWSFNSCRKFFGVPDGGYLYSPDGIQINEPEEKNEAYTVQHLLKRFNGRVSEGYTAFAENETLCNSDIKGMSNLSSHLLSNIDYAECINIRKENFTFLHHQFQSKNQFPIDCQEDAAPMAYPLLLNQKVEHASLWHQNLFVPVLWRDVFKRKTGGFETEKYLSQQLLPLPVDHRYSISDMQYITNLINNYD